MATLTYGPNLASVSSRRILGIDFFCGTAEEAIDRMRCGGLLVVPAAPALKDLGTNAGYRESLVNADLAISDSGLMVLIWNILANDRIARLSGLEYLRALLGHADVRASGNTLWVMANEKSVSNNVAWLHEQGISVPEECLYVAPMYESRIEDPELAERINRLRPEHVIVTLGGGVQERLGLWLKQQLEYRPAIHCVGAAIAFLSGDQVVIPEWVDHLYFGWLYRCVSNPRLYAPRYWNARKLVRLLVRYRSELPPLEAERLALLATLPPSTG